MKAIVGVLSKHGQTMKIGNEIARTLRHSGIATEVREIEIVSSTDFQANEVVIIGAPIYLGGHGNKLIRLVRNNVAIFDEEANRVTAFFSVSLSAAGTGQQQQDAWRCVEEFLAKCNWKPSLTEIFAGGLPYREYNWFTRWMMKRVVRKAGGDTDASKDHEYTDWNRVRNFASKIADAAYAKFSKDPIHVDIDSNSPDRN